MTPKSGGGGGTLHFRVDIILVKGLSQHTLNTHFPGIKKDPKYTFLHAFFFLHFFIMSFPKCVTMAKKTPFSYNFARFCIPKTMYACTLPCSEKKKKHPIYVKFLWGWYPTSDTSGSPPKPKLKYIQHSYILVHWLVKSASCDKK